VKWIILVCGLALLLVPGAVGAAVTVFSVAASSSHASVSHWQTNRVGDLTMMLRYSGKGSPAFNAYAIGENGLATPALNGICATTTVPGWITYACTGAPASRYEADIWPAKGSLSGTLSVAGETD
jgi:hypothetical protein